MNGKVFINSICGKCAHVDVCSITFKDNVQKCGFYLEERPHGEWIPCNSTRIGQVTNIDYKCSECSHHKDRPFPYCEICGAKMERR